MKTKILLLSLLLITNITGFGKVWQITNSGNTFTPATITINLGDTVNFAIGAYHNAQEVSEQTWGDNGTTLLTGGFDVPFNGGLVLPEKLGIGTHYFICKPHVSLGMKGTIIVQGTTSISKEQLLSDISIYPNPATDRINIKAGSDMLGALYSIADQSGRKVLTGEISEENTSLDISYLSNGLYFLKVGIKPENTFKLIKK